MRMQMPARLPSLPMMNAHLFNMATRRSGPMGIADGAFVALTGEHSGRSPNDRFVVDEDETNNEIAWGEVNKPISKDHFLGLKKKMLQHLGKKDLFVQDCY